MLLDMSQILQDWVGEGGNVDADCTEISMGMSGDYQEAILEGANLVRIGSSLFGERIYN